MPYCMFGLVYLFVIGHGMPAGDLTCEDMALLGGELALLVPLLSQCTRYYDGHLCVVYAAIHYVSGRLCIPCASYLLCRCV